MKTNDSRYVKRYFKIDTMNSVFSCAEKESKIDTDPSFKVQFRNLIGVKKNVVSMPSDLINKGSGKTNTPRSKLKEISIHE